MCRFISLSPIPSSRERPRPQSRAPPNVNGQPGLPAHGPGPFEAMEEYFREYPDDYVHDAAREAKFAFTFATRGFLIRR